MEDLATLLRESIDSKGWSLRDVEHESEKQGNRVSFSTVSKILKGSYKPGERILQGLSRALDIPIERLRVAAGLAEPGTPFKLPSYASRLSPEERSAVEHLVRVMVDAKDNRKGVGDDADGSAANRQAAGSAAEDELEARRAERGVTRKYTPPWEREETAATYGPDDGTPHGDPGIEDP